MSEQTDNHDAPAPLPSPSRRLHELTMAMATRSVAAKVESVTFKRVTVGDLKDQYVVESITTVRDEDDTLSDYTYKSRLALLEAHKVAEGMNSAIVREELAAIATQETLQVIRNPEPAGVAS